MRCLLFHLTTTSQQDGLKAHFTAVADAVSIPVIIYDIPGRSIVRLEDDVLAELANTQTLQE